MRGHHQATGALQGTLIDTNAAHRPIGQGLNQFPDVFWSSIRLRCCEDIVWRTWRAANALWVINCHDDWRLTEWEGRRAELSAV